MISLLKFIACSTLCDRDNICGAYMIVERKCYTVPLTSNECGGKVTESQGLISSPNFPSKYPNKLDCEWLIRYIIVFILKKVKC